MKSSMMPKKQSVFFSLIYPDLLVLEEKIYV